MYNPYHIHTFANVLITVLVLWTIPWKIYSVWLAAKHNRKAWFVVLLLVNTLSILEIIYIFKIENKKWEEVKADFRKGWEVLRHTKKKDFKSEHHHHTS